NAGIVWVSAPETTPTSIPTTSRTAPAAARCTRWGMLLGDAGLDPQASRRCLDSRRLYWRRHSEPDLPQPWYSCGGDRNRLRYSGDELPTYPGVFLPNPRSHDGE